MPRAAFIVEPRRVEVQPVTITDGPGQVRVRSRLIGISHGTEMLFYRGPFPAGQQLEALGSLAGATGYPVRYGYMNVGQTEDGRRVFAFYPHQSEFSCPADQLVPLPDDVPDDDAVFLPSMETALQIVHDSALRLGETALVMGLGVIGTLVALLLSRNGARVIALDPRPDRRERLTELGYPALDPMAPDVGARVAELTDGGPDMAVNTSGSSRALQLALDTLRPEGTVVEASWFGSGTTAVQLGSAFHRRRLTIRASQVSELNPAMRPRWNHARRTDTVISLLRDVRPSRFITHRFALDDAAQAFRTIDEGAESVFQVVLEP